MKKKTNEGGARNDRWKFQVRLKRKEHLKQMGDGDWRESRGWEV